MSDEMIGYVIAAVAEVLEVDPKHVSPDSRFLEDLGASSIDLAELFWQLEDDPRFQLGQIPDDAIAGFVRVRDVAAFLDQHVPRAPQAPADARVRVLIASDHAGYALKSALVRALEQQQVSLRDMGTDLREEVDFPEYAEAVAQSVAEGRAECGVLVGATGIGMAIAANKVPGARAAVVHDLLSARLSRQRYDVNILCLGAALLGEEVARCCLEEFLHAAFEPGRDDRWRRQISRIHEIEKRRPAQP
jgi:ribose 5-phosphate isomerase B